MAIWELAKPPCARLYSGFVGRDMQVPSPSFTLVQPYEADGIEIIHADFYRLGDASEVEALGLLDTLAEAITLVEWPERGDGVLPQTDFDIYLHTAGQLTARRIEIIANGDATRLTALQNDRRAGDIAAFLEQAGWRLRNAARWPVTLPPAALNA